MIVVILTTYACFPLHLSTSNKESRPKMGTTAHSISMSDTAACCLLGKKNISRYTYSLFGNFCSVNRALAKLSMIGLVLVIALRLQTPKHNGAAGHIILTPANQLMVMGLKIRSLSNPG
jgi:hypothetical protein